MSQITIDEAAIRLDIGEALLLSIIRNKPQIKVVETDKGLLISLEDFKAIELVIGLTRPPSRPEIFAGGISS